MTYLTTPRRGILFPEAELNRTMRQEVQTGRKQEWADGSFVGAFWRTLLDERMREYHIERCHFARQHKHPAGFGVEQWPSWDERRKRGEA